MDIDSFKVHIQAKGVYKDIVDELKNNFTHQSMKLKDYNQMG